MTNHRSLMTTTALSGAMAVSALVLAAGAAQAATATFAGSNNVTIATQSLNSAGTVSLSQAAQVLLVTLAGTDSCTAGTSIVVTAPSGVTFNTVPNFSKTAGTSTGVTGTGTLSAGNSIVTYSLSGCTTSAANNDVFTIGGATNPFALTTGTSLATATSTAKVFSVSATCGTFAVPTVANGLVSASGFTSTGLALATATVDTTATGAGKLFATSATAATRVAAIGNIVIANNANAVDAANGAPYALPGTSTGTVTISGSFAALSRMYAVTGTSCVTTAGGSLPSGSLTGTLSGSTVTISTMTASQLYTLCYENNGSTVIQAGGNTAAPITAVGSVSSLSGTSGSSTVGNLVYSGTAVSVNYVTGGSAYQYFLRVTNPASAASSVFAVVTKEDSSSFAGALNTNLGANNNALFSIADVNTATGANLTASDRARIQVLTSQGSATVGGILFNTATGVITTAN